MNAPYGIEKSAVDIDPNIRKDALRLSLVGFLASFCILFVIWYIFIRPFYFPSGDEFSLISNSAHQYHPLVRNWFLKGFSSYFLAYPEWTTPYTDFLRPVANCTYYLNSLVFGTHWAEYLLTNYAIQSGIVALTIYIARRWLLRSPLASLTLGTLVFISPAFGVALYKPAFAFDLLAALFVLGAANEILARRLWQAFVLLTLAVFTKETSLPVIVAIALFLGWENYRSGSIKRALSIGAIFVLPGVAWYALRMVDFGKRQGVYALQGGHHLGVILNGLKTWPVPVPVPDGPKWPDLPHVVLNPLFWALIAFGLVFVFRPAHPPVRFQDRVIAFGNILGIDTRAKALISILFLGSLIPLVLLGLVCRFGALCIPLFILVVWIVSTDSSSRVLRVAAIPYIVLPWLFSIAYQTMKFKSDLQFYNFQWSMARSYVNTIASAHTTSLFIADDATSSFCSAVSMKKFTGDAGNIILINNVSPPGVSSGQRFITVEQLAPDRLLVTSALDGKTLHHAFDGASSREIRQKTFSRNVGTVLMVYTHSAPDTLTIDLRHIQPGSRVMFPNPARTGYMLYPQNQRDKNQR